MSEAIEHIGVVGAGTMGHGIAQVAAQSGYRVTLVDVSQSALEKGLAKIEKGFERLLGKGEISEDDRDAARERLSSGGELKDLADCQLVVEAAVEKLEVKREIFGELDRVCAPSALLASNTSSISITKLAATTGRPEPRAARPFSARLPICDTLRIVTGRGGPAPAPPPPDGRADDGGPPRRHRPPRRSSRRPPVEAPRGPAGRPPWSSG